MKTCFCCTIHVQSRNVLRLGTDCILINFLDVSSSKKQADVQDKQEKLARKRLAYR